MSSLQRRAPLSKRQQSQGPLCARPPKAPWPGRRAGPGRVGPSGSRQTCGTRDDNPRSDRAEAPDRATCGRSGTRVRTEATSTPSARRLRGPCAARRRDSVDMRPNEPCQPTEREATPHYRVGREKAGWRPFGSRALASNQRCGECAKARLEHCASLRGRVSFFSSRIIITNQLIIL